MHFINKIRVTYFSRLILILILLYIQYPCFSQAHWGKTPQYLSSILKKIKFFLIYPQEAKDKRKEGEAKIKFTLLKSGKVKEVKIVKSTGISSLDKTILWAIYAAIPYPFPQGYEGDSLDIVVPITFSTPAIPKEKEKAKEGWGREIGKKLPITEEEYILLIQRVINFYLGSYPEVKNLSKQGTMKIEFIVNKNGRVSKLKIIESSGSLELDRIAKEIIKEASPFPSPPIYLGKDKVKVTIPIIFEPLSKKKEIKAKSKKNLLFEAKDEIFQILKTQPLILTLYRIGATNSQPLKVSEGQIKLARHKVNEALRALFPFLSAEYKEDKGESITDRYKSKNYGIKLEHILYDHNQRNYTLRREKLNLEVAEKNYEKERNNLLYEILKAYYQLCAEKEILTYWENLKKEINKDYELAQLLQEGKLITRIEYLKISSLINKVLSELVAQKNKYILALANLKKTLGISPGEDIPNLKLTELCEYITIKEDIEEYIKMGLERRPEVALWEKSIEATRLGYKVAKNEKKPKLLIESFWGKSGEAFGWQDLDLATTWNVVGKVVWLFGGSSSEFSYTHEKTLPTEIAEVSNKVKTDSISFKTNILDKIKYYSEVAESKIAMDQALDELEKIKKDIAWEIQEGFTAYLEGSKEIEMYREEKRLRLQELELKKELFQAGEIELSELIDNKIKLTQSEASLVRGKLKLYQGIILLDKGTGFYSKLIEKL